MPATKRTQQNGVNKSAAIRDLLAKNPKLSANDIVATLAKKGISVTSTLVYVVKGKKQANGQTKRPATSKTVKTKSAGKKAVTPKAVTTSSVANPAVAVLKVKGLAAEVGGMKNLGQLVDALAD